ncbi:ZPR1 zinc finger domain-containing protein [Candidatus Woesearchaeota archaeon]|nr:ZPR1 zinc finger domain-containing protein [Candidatus Woesearchaeota archaeon]
MQKLEHEPCPFCKKKTLSLTEDEVDIPYFGKCFLFSMQCSSCKYFKSDVEAAERKEPIRYTLEVNSTKDMNIRIVKSSEATIKIPQLKVEVTPGPASEGYITNVEGVLQRFKKQIGQERDNADDDEVREKAKSLLKKFWKVECGDVAVKIVIEDPSGNSAIVSEKAKIEQLK